MPHAEAEALESEVKVNAEELPRLAGLVLKQWQINAEHRRQELQEDLLAAHYLRAAKYSSERLLQIEADGEEPVYAPLAAMQSITGAASCRQVLLPAGERPWSIKHTPIPDLPAENLDAVESQYRADVVVNPSVKYTGRKAFLEKSQRELLNKRAEKECAYAAQKIEDDFISSGFYTVLSDFLEDFATYPFAVLKRTTIREKQLEWKKGKPVVVEKIKDIDERVSPFDIYPAPGMVGMHDGPLIERLRLRDADLAMHRSVPGFITENVDKIVTEKPYGWLVEWGDAERNDAEMNNLLNWGAQGDLIDVLRMWAKIPGDVLLEHGVQIPQKSKSEQARNPLATEFYDTEVWFCKGQILRVAINPHPLDRRPYYKAVWRSVPGQFAGSSPPLQVQSLADMCNSTMRALAKNMGLSAGPQVVLMIDMLPQGEEEVVDIYSNKIWQARSRPGVSQAPVTFFQPTSNARELISVFQHYWELAGDVTGIYRWNYGADQGMQGAAQTMNGLAMLLENSNKVIRHAIQNLEEQVLKPRVYDQYLINMLYAKDEDRILGDIEIVARGSSSLIERASIRQRRVEIMNALNSLPEQEIPVVKAFVSKIRLLITNDTLRDLDIHEDAMPEVEELLKQIDEFMEQQGQNPQPKDPRVEAAEIARDSRIEDQKLEMEDRQLQRDHQVQIKQMEGAMLQQSMEKSGQKTFDAQKLKTTESLVDLQEKRRQFDKELQVKVETGEGI